MRVLNKQELALIAILAHPQIARNALRMTADHIDLFSRIQSPHVNLMWESYLKLRVKNKGKKIGNAVLKSELAEAIASDMDMPPELVERCDYILDKFDKGEDIPSLEDSAELLQTMVHGDLNRKLSRLIGDDAAISEMAKAVNQASGAVSELGNELEEDNRYVFNPFKEIDKFAIHTTRLPTGINWMDELTSGGGRGGEMWLILGPPAGGKTAISVQYACAQALMGNTTVWATYEQSLEGDIAERIISYVTDESLDNIRDVGFENLPEDVQRRFWASVAGTDDRLVVLDMTRKKHVTEEDPQDYGGIWSVWKEVKRLKAEGKKVRTVLIDWVGAMMQRVAANSGKDIANKFRFHTEHELMVAKEMVKKEDVQIIFFHQVDSKTAHAKPTYLPDMTCAKDMHDLSNYMDIVMILGRRDKNNVCYMNCDKSRKGAAVTRTIQLIGDKARFVAANGWIPDRDGNFYKPSDSYMPEDPDDARSDVNTIFSREVD